MNIWFTSDTHFGHARILEYCKDTRPFDSVSAMDEALIATWNKQVRPNDTVYHLGDFAFKDAEQTLRVLKRLHGRIHLIYGNHDKVMRKPEVLAHLAWAGDYLEQTIQGQRVIMFHYPIHEWNAMHHGSYHLFGHVHGARPLHGRAMDVGVDAHGMRLLHWNDVHRHLKDLPILAHHAKQGDENTAHPQGEKY